MDFIKRLFFYQRPDALENSPLRKIPIELLWQVANRLPTVSAASFSLSCRYIYLSLGTQYLETLANSHQETLEFLHLLERDLQNQIVCYPCRRLHRIQNAKRYTRYGRSIWSVVMAPCVFADQQAMITRHIYDNFSTTVFKMAMKHYHHFGDDTRSRQLLKLLSRAQYSSHGWRTWAKKAKADCQIKNKSLLTCTRIAFHGTCIGAEQARIFHDICPHLEVESIQQPASLRITTRSPLRLEEKWSVSIHYENSIVKMKKESWKICSEVQQCRYCRTEYRASFKHNAGCTIEVIITIWKDLGQGPEAAVWKAHLPGEYDRLLPQPVNFQAGEIASAFSS